MAVGGVVADCGLDAEAACVAGTGPLGDAPDSAQVTISCGAAGWCKRKLGTEDARRCVDPGLGDCELDVDAMPGTSDGQATQVKGRV